MHSIFPLWSMLQAAGLGHLKQIDEHRHWCLKGGKGTCVPTTGVRKEVPFEDEWKRVTGRA